MTVNNMTYPQVQAIEPMADYAKHIKGMTTGKVILFAGVAIAAGLSNGLSGLDIIPEHTVGMYGGIIAVGIAIAVLGFITILVNALKLKARDNPHYASIYGFNSYKDNDRITQSNIEYGYGAAGIEPFASKYGFSS